MFGDYYRFGENNFQYTPTKFAKLSGILKAKPTGNLVGEKKMFVEVEVAGYTIPARPCFNMGGRAFVPTQEFLDKYKNEIFLYVGFEEENIRRCVVLGWCFNTNKENDLGNWPNEAFFRSYHFLEQFDDKNEDYIVTHRESGDYQKFGKKGFFSKVRDFFIEVVNKWHVKTKIATIESSDIRLTGDMARQKAVRGDDLNDNLSEIVKQLSEVCSVLQTQCSTMATICRSSGPLTPLSGPLQQLGSKAGIIKSKVTAINSKLAKHLSRKIKLD